MVSIKVSLTVTAKSGTLMSEQECSKNPKKCYEDCVMKVEDGKGKYEVIRFKVRKAKDVKRSLNLSEEAYRYMTAKSNNREADAANCPYWSKAGKWFVMSKKQRLEAHLHRIMEDFGGYEFSYEVFED